jgi:hypothetical protein
MAQTQVPAMAQTEALPGGTEAPPNRVLRWARRDPVAAVAAVMIAVHLIWRADIASRGFLAVDDFVLSARAAESNLTVDYLLFNHGNHFMPAGMLTYWLVVRGIGLTYWPYLVLLLAFQAAIAITFFRLLRRLLPPGWGVLLPLGILLFTPLTLDATSLWIVGLLLLPMQLALVLAVGAQVRYARTRRVRHLVSLGLALVLGLAFSEKSLLIVPFVFVLTACLLVEGGPVRSVVRAVGRFWLSWLVVGGISAAYLVLYFSRAPESSLRTPTSPAEVLVFVRQFVGDTLIPGLVGGPWGWLDTGDDFPPLVAPGGPLRLLTWIAAGVLIVVTVRRRPVATRAWVLLAAYLLLVCALLAATRLGTQFSSVAGLATRYASDAVLVAALCIGVACFGLAGAEPAAVRRPWTVPAILREPGAVAIGLLVAAIAVVATGVGVAVSAGHFTSAWSVKQGRDFLRTSQAELATAGPDTVFFDLPVPERIIPSLSWPYNLQSRFFKAARHQPVFVTEAENPSIFDGAGHIRPAGVDGIATPPGPEPGCGYKLGGGLTYRLLLDRPQFAWTWAVRVGYLASADATATIRLGEGSHDFDVHRGLHQIIFMIEGGGPAVQFTVHEPGVTVCVDQVAIGNLVPR